MPELAKMFTSDRSAVDMGKNLDLEWLTVNSMGSVISKTQLITYLITYQALSGFEIGFD